MRMQFGLSSFERAEGDLPELPVINMYAEAAPTEEAGVVLQSRRGLDDRSASMGAGPVEALFKKDGVLGGGLFGVSAGALYSSTASLGSIGGLGPFSLAGYEDKLFVAGGSSLYAWDGATLATVAFPDAASVTKVVVGASRAICLRADTETYDWSDPLTSTMGALSFASAESQPDRLRDCLFIDDILVLFGAETIEFHANTGSSTLPFQPIEGRVFEKGIKATGCATAFGSTFAWVTNRNQICIGDPGNIVSTPGLEAKIAASTDVALWSFDIDGTEFLCVRTDTGSWAMGARSKLWSQWASWGEGNWLANCYADGIFGSAVDGKTLQFGDDYTEVGGVLERRFRAGKPLNSGGTTLANISIRSNPGNTPYLSGTYMDPTIEMRVSRDAGKTWGAWKPRQLGENGDYRQLVQWRALGMASRPGFMAEFRLTDPVPFRVSDVLVNEPYGGR